ncbi:hypothetical protein Tco_0941340, partial [Tanacetum coccineum]
MEAVKNDIEASSVVCPGYLLKDAYGVGVGKGTSSSMQFKGALEMQLVVQRQVHEQVEETMEQSRHLEYAVNFWYYKHGLLQMKVSSICIMLVCYRYYPYVGVFEIGITLGLESELRTARWSMILSRLSTVVELIQKLLQQNRKVLGSRSVAKKVELKAYTCDINRDDGPEPILQDPIALGSTHSLQEDICFNSYQQQKNKCDLEQPTPTKEYDHVKQTLDSQETEEDNATLKDRSIVEMKTGEGTFGVRKVIGIEDREETRYKAKLEDRARREEELFTRAPPSSVENKKLKHMHESRFRIKKTLLAKSQGGCSLADAICSAIDLTEAIASSTCSETLLE